MNPLQCHTELKDIIGEQGFASGQKTTITPEEIDSLNYKLTEEFLKENLDSEMFTYKTFLEIASQAGRLN